MPAKVSVNEDGMTIACSMFFEIIALETSLLRTDSFAAVIEATTNATCGFCCRKLGAQKYQHLDENKC
jgi:hypothetical protein